MRCQEWEDEVQRYPKIVTAQLLGVKILRFEKKDFFHQYQHVIMQLLSQTCMYAGVSLYGYMRQGFKDFDILFYKDTLVVWLIPTS